MVGWCWELDSGPCIHIEGCKDCVSYILQEPSKKSKATTEELAREVDVRGWERACYTTQNYRVSGNSQGFTYNGRHI